MVGGKGVGDELLPALLVGVGLERATDGTEKRICGVLLEIEAIGLGAGSTDGIGQSARVTDDRHRAVGQGDHLPESAGLIAGWHQEHVGAGIDTAGEMA